MSFIEKSLLKRVAKRLDEKIKFKGALELMDGIIFRSIITLLDGHLAYKVPEKYQGTVIAFLTAFADDDYSNIDEELVEQINELVDIPGLNEEAEGILLKCIIELFRNLILAKKD